MRGTSTVFARPGCGRNERRGRRMTELSGVLLSPNVSRRRGYRAVITECALIICECASAAFHIIADCAPANGVVIAPKSGCYRAVTFSGHRGGSSFETQAEVFLLDTRVMQVAIRSKSADFGGLSAPLLPMQGGFLFRSRRSGSHISSPPYAFISMGWHGYCCTIRYDRQYT